MKYITSKDNDIVIFSNGITHHEMANMTKFSVRGAGFVNLDRKECYGESYSLGIKSHEDDTRTLRYHILNR